MNWLCSTASALLGYWETLKGVPYIQVVPLHQYPHESLRIKISTGAEIEIFCKEQRCCVTYEAWWARKRTVTTYHVYSIFSADMPEALKEKFSSDFSTAALLPALVGRALQKKAAINAYIAHLNIQHKWKAA